MLRSADLPTCIHQDAVSTPGHVTLQLDTRSLSAPTNGTLFESNRLNQAHIPLQPTLTQLT